MVSVAVELRSCTLPATDSYIWSTGQRALHVIQRPHISKRRAEGQKLCVGRQSTDLLGTGARVCWHATFTDGFGIVDAGRRGGAAGRAGPHQGGASRGGGPGGGGTGGGGGEEGASRRPCRRPLCPPRGLSLSHRLSDCGLHCHSNAYYDVQLQFLSFPQMTLPCSTLLNQVSLESLETWCSTSLKRNEHLCTAGTMRTDSRELTPRRFGFLWSLVPCDEWPSCWPTGCAQTGSCRLHACGMASLFFTIANLIVASILRCADDGGGDPRKPAAAGRTTRGPQLRDQAALGRRRGV